MSKKTKVEPTELKTKSQSIIPRKVIIYSSLLMVVCLSLILSVVLFLSNRVYPQVYVANTNIGILKHEDAVSKVNTSIKQRVATPLEFSYNNSTDSANAQKFSLDISNMESKPEESIDQAFEYGHNKVYLKPAHLNLSFNLDQQTIDQFKEIAQTINQNPIDSQLKIEEGEINVTPSQEGIVLDEEELKRRIEGYLNTGTLQDNMLPVKRVYPKLSYQTAADIKVRLDQLKLEPLKLTFKERSFALDLATIISMIDLENTKDSLISLSLPEGTFNISSLSINGTEYTDSKIILKNEKITEFLSSIAPQINQAVQEPLFQVENTGGEKPKIKEFKPPQEGYSLDTKQAAEKIAIAILNPGQKSVQLPVNIEKPKNKLANDLGINELIGRGVSNFAGSIPNRIFNVELAASKINGVLIAPGETFSFVNTVGDISSATGYKQAYVIKSGRTVLDDGGGVCQVSTTIFRAALNSGMPIVKRTAHAYRVGYYEQGFPPGLDATIFHPSVDFQFKNDTSHHILIQAYALGTTLTVDLYGTSDGRVAQVSTPVVTSRTPAPPEIRQDDPTLPKGTVKQVDFAAAGANVVFTRTVTRGGETIINETFRSNYRPWQAVFLVGTGG